VQDGSQNFIKGNSVIQMARRVSRGGDVPPRERGGSGERSGDGPRKKKSPTTPKGTEGDKRSYTYEVADRFRARLKAILEYKRMSVRTLVTDLENHVGGSQIYGVSRSSVNRWLNQKSGPSVGEMALLAQFFKTTVDAFLDPTIPVDQLPEADAYRHSRQLSEKEWWIMNELVRRMGVEVAIDRLTEARSAAPTSDQIEKIIVEVIRRLGLK
jgi:transcriptional regulator with XRE-family HTH domain